MGIGHVDGSSRHLWRFYGFFCGFSFWIAKGPLQKLRAIDSLNRQNQACIEGSTTLEALDPCVSLFIGRSPSFGTAMVCLSRMNLSSTAMDRLIRADA